MATTTATATKEATTLENYVKLMLVINKNPNLMMKDLSTLCLLTIELTEVGLPVVCQSLDTRYDWWSVGRSSV